MNRTSEKVKNIIKKSTAFSTIQESIMHLTYTLQMHTCYIKMQAQVYSLPIYTLSTIHQSITDDVNSLFVQSNRAYPSPRNLKQIQSLTQNSLISTLQSTNFTLSPPTNQIVLQSYLDRIFLQNFGGKTSNPLSDNSNDFPFVLLIT